MTNPIIPQQPAPQGPEEIQPHYSAYPQQGQQQHATPPTPIPPIDPNQPHRRDLRQTNKGTSGLAITALVIGIISIVLSWVPIINNFAAFLALVGIIFGIIGITRTGHRSKKKGRGIAIAGTVLSVIAIIVTLITQSAYGKALDKVTNTGSTPKASSATIKKDNLAACKTLLGDDMKIVTGIPDLITGIGDNATTKQQDQLEKTHLKIEDARKQAESGLAGHLASLDTPFKQAYDVMHGGGGSIDMDTSHVENDITNVMNDCADAGYKIADTNTDESSDSSVDEKPLASVSGGKYAGKDNTGFGSGTFTVRNDSDKPLKSVSLTVSELDASGNILQETYPQLDSDLQPGQSANLEYLLSPDDLTKTRSVQVTKLSWMLDDNGDGFQEVSVSSDPVQVK